MVKLTLVPAALALAVLSGCATAPAAPLFNGHDFNNFTLESAPQVAPEAVYAQRPDGVITVAGKPSGFFATRETYTNFRLHAEWRWPGNPGNAGVLLHISDGPRDGVWPYSVQVQTKHGFAGDILPMAHASFAEPLTSAPGAYPAIKAHTAPDSEKPEGEWNSLDVVAKDGTVEVKVNGVEQNRITNVAPRSGRIGFQLEGTPYELRNVRVTRLD